MRAVLIVSLQQNICPIDFYIELFGLVDRPIVHQNIKTRCLLNLTVQIHITKKKYQKFLALIGSAMHSLTTAVYCVYVYTHKNTHTKLARIGV